MVSWVLYAKFRIEKHCLVKDFAFLKNVCYLLKVPIIFWKSLYFEFVIVFLFFVAVFFYELMIDPQPTFLGPGYSSRTVNTFLIKGKTIYDRSIYTWGNKYKTRLKKNCIIYRNI